MLQWISGFALTKNNVAIPQSQTNIDLNPRLLHVNFIWFLILVKRFISDSSDMADGARLLWPGGLSQDIKQVFYWIWTKVNKVC